MVRKRLLIGTIVAALALIVACSKDESPTEPENGGPLWKYRLGFTD